MVLKVFRKGSQLLDVKGTQIPDARRKSGPGVKGVLARSDPAWIRATAPRGDLAVAVVEVDAVPWVDAVSHIVVLH
jgi:hypothetical protein